jgi:GNAT superfamily N-acetyltransferase
MVDSSAFRRLTRSPGPWRPVRRPGHAGVRHCRPVAAPSWPAGPAAADVVTDAGVTLRVAGPQDAVAAREMHGRCSAWTLAQRYHGPPGDADRYLAHLLSPRHGHTVAAWTPDGELVGLGHLLWDGEDTEVALLVEDAWQRRGLGAALLRRLITLAVQADRHSVYAVTQSSGTAMLRVMRATGLPVECQRSEGTLVITATLAPLPSSPVLSGPAAAP